MKLIKPINAIILMIALYSCDKAESKKERIDGLIDNMNTLNASNDSILNHIDSMTYHLRGRELENLYETADSAWKVNKNKVSEYAGKYVLIKAPRTNDKSKEIAQLEDLLGAIASMPPEYKNRYHKFTVSAIESEIGDRIAEASDEKWRKENPDL